MDNDDFYRKSLAGYNHSKVQQDFKRVDRKELLKMSDTDLALWQSDYSQESPHYRLAEHEWQRRLTHEQVQATKYAAWMGFAGVVLGFLLAQIPGYITEAKTNSNGNQKMHDQPAPPTPEISHPKTNVIKGK